MNIQKSHLIAFSLQSLNLLRKYSGPLDIFLSFWSDYNEVSIPIMGYASWQAGGIPCLWKSWCVLWRAMNAHKSQFVWYRRLFVVFSSYTYVNYVQSLRYESKILKDSNEKREFMIPWKPVLAILFLFTLASARSESQVSRCTEFKMCRIHNVLITGGAGYIGSHMALRLLQDSSENFMVFYDFLYFS